MDDEFVEKNKGLKIFLKIFVVLIILGGIGFGGYILLQKTILNPKNYLDITKKLLNDGINSHFKININDNKDSNIKGKITFKTDSKDLKNLNKLNIDYDILSSINKEEVQYNFKFKESDKEILDTNMYFIKDSIYLDSKDLFSKIILLDKLDFNIFEELKGTDKNNYTKAFNNYINYLFDSLKEAKMNSSFVSIYQVKYAYEIDDSNRDKIQNKYDEFIKNDKTIQLLIKNEKIDKELFNVKFNNIKIEIIKSVGIGKIYKIQIKDNNKETFLLEMDKDDDNLYHLKTDKETGSLTIDKDTYTLNIYENEQLKDTYKLVLNDKLIRFSITSSDMDMSISLKEDNKESSITFSIKEKDGVNFEVSESVHKENDVTEINAYIDIVLDGEKIKIKIDGKEEEKENLLTNKEISDYVELNKLSENEQNKIFENLYKKLENTKLLEMLSKQEITTY